MSFYEQAGKCSLLNEVDELYILSGDKGDLEIIKSRMSDNSKKIQFLTIREFLNHFRNIMLKKPGIYPPNRKEPEFNHTAWNLTGI